MFFLDEHVLTSTFIGTGEDDPDTSKKDIMTQGAKWVQAAGAVVVSEGEETGIEVSPLISYVSLN